MKAVVRISKPFAAFVYYPLPITYIVHTLFLRVFAINKLPLHFEVMQHSSNTETSRFNPGSFEFTNLSPWNRAVVNPVEPPLQHPP